ncbi:MAG: hypothetical protein ACI841_000624, partial [Planctomycetota bacterium]
SLLRVSPVREEHNDAFLALNHQGVGPS